LVPPVLTGPLEQPVLQVPPDYKAQQAPAAQQALQVLQVPPDYKAQQAPAAQQALQVLQVPLVLQEPA
jgi:hypothetical protein